MSANINLVKKETKRLQEGCWGGCFETFFHQFEVITDDDNEIEYMHYVPRFKMISNLVNEFEKCGADFANEKWFSRSKIVYVGVAGVRGEICDYIYSVGEDYDVVISNIISDITKVKPYFPAEFVRVYAFRESFISEMELSVEEFEVVETDTVGFIEEKDGNIYYVSPKTNRRYNLYMGETWMGEETDKCFIMDTYLTNDEYVSRINNEECISERFVSWSHVTDMHQYEKDNIADAIKYYEEKGN